MYLTTYDISKNSRRAWLAGKLLELGFERLRKSIYLGLETPFEHTEVKKLLG